ncbi:hypothetical protein [Vibrio alfacsensis]|uniref:hypothetical protein n=1 Tax=Vibrio alfacsensis TaxID=1074311 RepID=UPI0040681C95
MAIQPKHSDLPPRYDVTDFTNEQRHRFTTVANEAHRRRTLYQRALEKKLVSAAKERAVKPLLSSGRGKPNKTRQVIWLVTFLLIGLWMMYMFA